MKNNKFQIQEAQRIRIRIITKKNTPKHIRVRPKSKENKRKI